MQQFTQLILTQTQSYIINDKANSSQSITYDSNKIQFPLMLESSTHGSLVPLSNINKNLPLGWR